MNLTWQAVIDMNLTPVPSFELRGMLGKLSLTCPSEIAFTLAEWFRIQLGKDFTPVKQNPGLTGQAG
jgi:hypothetical protein